jgi:hypothetical protein
MFMQEFLWEDVFSVLFGISLGDELLNSLTSTLRNVAFKNSPKLGAGGSHL